MPHPNPNHKPNARPQHPGGPRPGGPRPPMHPKKHHGPRLPAEISQLEAANHKFEKQQAEAGEKPPTSLKPDAGRKTILLSGFRKMTTPALADMAEGANIENVARLRRHELIFALVRARATSGEYIYGEGTLEVMPEGYGFLRYPDQSYVAGVGDIYVGVAKVRQYFLSTGDVISGWVRTPFDKERYFSLSHPDTINGASAADSVKRRRVVFENLTPYFPTEHLGLEREMRAEENITSRIIDMVSPIGKGQRGLLVASPKSGKTVILQQIAHAIEENFPDVTLMVLLIDERPEEVTEMKRSVRGEVVSSTFDEAASRHIQIAELVIEKAKRQVEMKKDVVILLDSITRLARAYNTMQPSSGRVLTGGVDAQALQRPKRFFGSARNIEEGGSLTIIATALIETGSKMDEVIYEEFKGTGNMELHLDRRIAERRTYPSILVNKSGTRREDLLVDEAVLKNIWVLRKALSTMEEDKQIEFLLDKLRQTKSNKEFFNLMKKGAL